MNTDEMTYSLIFGLLLIFFLALGARSLKSFSRHKLEEFCKQRNAGKKLLNIIKTHDSIAGAATLVRIIVTIYFVAVIVFHTVVKHGPERSFFTLFPWISFILLLFALYYLPRVTAKIWGTGFVFYTWNFWYGLNLLAYPLTAIDRFISVFFHRLADVEEETDEDDFEEEIRTMVTEGHREGLLEDDAREIIEGAMKLRDVTVSEVMTPRIDMQCIAENLSWDEMLHIVSASSHSRIPVYKETRDDIIGVLHAKNLLRELATGDAAQRQHWTEILSEPLFVPETKPVDALLREFQNVKPHQSGSQTVPKTNDKARGHLAIVLDEYGGVAGIVTLEDLLEEIVGEITDEHDTLVIEEDIVEIAPNIFDVLGKVRIDELNSQLDLHLPDEEDYDTAAGYIFSTLGHIPETGEEVIYEYEGNSIKLTVVEVKKRRIEKLRIDTSSAT
ncbi:hemolysin activation protein [Planctomycetales bacterium]|nr:hemolysin activation protein [Planctomycetales bacterium]